MTLDDLYQRWDTAISIVKNKVCRYDEDDDASLNERLSYLRPDHPLNSPDHFVEWCDDDEDRYGSNNEKIVQVAYDAATLYIVARDDGVDAALLLKLTAE